jgi:hypothetical protein
MQNQDDNIIGRTLYELVNILREIKLDQEEKKKR